MFDTPMRLEVLTHWQQGWSIARGWTNYTTADGITTVHIAEPDRRVEYVTTAGHALEAARQATTNPHPPGTSWLTVATNAPRELAATLPGVDYIRTEHLMTIALADQTQYDVPAPYVAELVSKPPLIDIHLYGHGELAATGRMSVHGEYAVADMIQTLPSHRRRGLARAVMSALTTTARTEGATQGLLAASPEGRLLYESLGWTTVTDLLVARTELLSAR
jgi:GNAT superfamily N-acetyltransferase